MSSGTIELMSFFQSLRPYFCPSNSGAWSGTLAYFISTFISELTRHIAKSLSHKICPSSCPNVFSSGMHLSTTQYISGSLLILIIEGLYGKNMYMVQFASACLKNLAAVHPELVDIVMPILLGALDDVAVNQSHQAPAAMHAITLAFRQFMYPQPVVLSYLPELLRWSINGIDSNDSTKTSITLNMYCHILSWLPIKKNYDSCLDASRVYPDTYLSMVTEGGAQIEDKARVAYSALGMSVNDGF